MDGAGSMPGGRHVYYLELLGNPGKTFCRRSRNRFDPSKSDLWLVNETIKKEIKELEKMKLPELQARYAEVIGEETKAPNKKYLIKRIALALEENGAQKNVD